MTSLTATRTTASPPSVGRLASSASGTPEPLGPRCFGSSVCTPFGWHQHTTDIDEQAGLLRGWQQRYRQLSPGAFEGSLTEASLDGVRLMHETTSHALLQHGCLPTGTLAIGLPLSGGTSLRLCGQSCRAQHLIVFSGQAGFEFRSPGSLQIVDLVLETEVLQSPGSPADPELEAILAGDPHLRLLPLPWRRCLLQLADDVLKALAPGIPQHPVHAWHGEAAGCRHGTAVPASASPRFEPARSAADMPPHTTTALPSATQRALMRKAIQETVLEALAATRPAGPRRSQQQLQRIVLEARSLLAPADGVLPECIGPPGIGDACQQLGLSRRSLQHAFQQVLGISPLAWLRAVRLDGARRAIKQQCSVAEAATAWGFWHLGRFARDYARLFGERPSDTARRCRDAGRSSLRT